MVRADEGEYMVTYGERGSKVVLVASEPITRSASHWVAVPRNSALVVARSKGGAVDVVQTPLAPGGAHPRQAEVQQYAPSPPVSIMYHLLLSREAAIESCLQQISHAYRIPDVLTISNMYHRSGN